MLLIKRLCINLFENIDYIEPVFEVETYKFEIKLLRIRITKSY